MIRRIEFTLNLDNPSEAVLYEALADLLRHRRAGEVIRRALTAHFFGSMSPRPIAQLTHSLVATQADGHGRVHAGPEAAPVEQIVAQTAAMFGF